MLLCYIYNGAITADFTPLKLKIYVFLLFSLVFVCFSLFFSLLIVCFFGACLKYDRLQDAKKPFKAVFSLVCVGVVSCLALCAFVPSVAFCGSWRVVGVGSGDVVACCVLAWLCRWGGRSPIIYMCVRGVLPHLPLSKKFFRDKGLTRWGRCGIMGMTHSEKKSL